MTFELADILIDNLDFIESLGLSQHKLKVLYDIMYCRTEKLGRHSNKKCSNPDCKEEVISYNSCRNNHCPKCTGSKQIKWTADRCNEILPVNYSHAVFRPPQCYSKLFENNPEDCYNMLFNSANETLKVLLTKNNSSKLKYGMIAALHTWDQKINYYSHLHCLIPEGQFDTENNRWKNSNNKVLKKDILNVTFQKILAKKLIKWIRKNNYTFPGITEEYITKKSKTVSKCVYIKKSIKNVTSVIKYLSTYTNKVAITNNRIKDYNGTDVKISYVDRADGNKIKNETIKAEKLIKLFCLHILPKKLPRVRYYGFLANSCKKKYLKVCNKLLEKSGNKLSKESQKAIESAIKLYESIGKPQLCKVCHKGFMITTALYSGRYGPYC